MITEKMMKWLETATLETKYYNLYHNRIQDQIDKNIEMAIQLAKKHPDILLNENRYIHKHKRLQDLLLIIKILKPHLDVYLEIAKEVKRIL